MSEIRICQVHGLSKDDAKARLQQFEDAMSKYGVKAVWKGDGATLKGTGVSGEISVDPQNVVVVLKLGLLARAAGVDPKRLEGSITKRLTEAFSVG